MRILVFEAGNLDSRKNKIPMKTQHSKMMTALLALALLAILGATTKASVVDLVNGNSGSANDGQFIWTPEQPTGTERNRRSEVHPANYRWCCRIFSGERAARWATEQVDALVLSVGHHEGSDSKPVLVTF